MLNKKKQTFSAYSGKIIGWIDLRWYLKAKPTKLAGIEVDVLIGFRKYECAIEGSVFSKDVTLNFIILDYGMSPKVFVVGKHSITTRPLIILNNLLTATVSSDGKALDPNSLHFFSSDIILWKVYSSEMCLTQWHTLAGGARLNVIYTLTRRHWRFQELTLWGVTLPTGGG